MNQYQNHPYTQPYQQSGNNSRHMGQHYQTPRPKEMKIPKLTNRIAENYIAYTLGVDATHLKMVRLPETLEQSWKHACVPSGVVLIPTYEIYYAQTRIVYSFCHMCRKVSYYFERD